MGNPLRGDGETGSVGVHPAVAYFQKEAMALFSETGSCLNISANASAVIKKRKAELMRRGFIKTLSERDQIQFVEFLSTGSKHKPLRVQLQDQWLELSFIRDTGEGLAVLMQNITEQVKQANALRKMSLEAELALRGQSEFFAHISHELRTPLNAIMGFSEMMCQEVFGEIENPRYRDYLKILQQSSNQLLGKINDLLEISSLYAGMDQLNEKHVPLDDLVKSVVQVHARDLFAQHIDIEVEIIRCNLIADRLKLQQALTPLLNNAIKFSPPESLIRLTAERSVDGGLEIILTDEGEGFSDEQLDYLDQSGDEHLSIMERNRRMMGFGLPLARELVFRHGGQLEFSNREEGGAQVILRLPRERVVGIRGDHRSVPLKVSRMESCA
jgi:signal transduction histidine kinase